MLRSRRSFTQSALAACAVLAFVGEADAGGSLGNLANVIAKASQEVAKAAEADLENTPEERTLRAEKKKIDEVKVLLEGNNSKSNRAKAKTTLTSVRDAVRGVRKTLCEKDCGQGAIQHLDKALTALGKAIEQL